jgi:hypothetical protein
MDKNTNDDCTHSCTGMADGPDRPDCFGECPMHDPIN